MVLHPTGCGRVARRRIQLTGSPDGFNPPGLSLYARKTLPRNRKSKTCLAPQSHEGNSRKYNEILIATGANPRKLGFAN